MKKIIVSLIALVVSAASLHAQGGGPQLSVEQRVARVHEKLEESLKLDAAKLALTDSVFTAYYTAVDEMRAGGRGGDREAMREKMMELTGTRDAALKEILNADDFKKWKAEIEPSLRPQRPGGQRQRGNQ